MDFALVNLSLGLELSGLGISNSESLFGLRSLGLGTRES